MKYFIFTIFLTVGCSGGKIKTENATGHQDKEGVAVVKSSDDTLDEEQKCELEKDNRVIQKWSHSSGSCYVSYEKFGKKSEVAKARFNKEYCQEIFDRIVSKLKDSGFSCSN
jgi:hypothetical protein